MQLTKTDFLLYLDAPMHLWAQKHHLLETCEPTPFDQYLISQGRQIEEMAEDFLQSFFQAHYSEPEVMRQKSFTDGAYQARADVVVYDREGQACDLYEIKSSTSVAMAHLYDVAFQYLVYEASLHIRQVYIVHLDKEYVRAGDLDLAGLFVVEDLTAAVAALLEEVRSARKAAWQVAIQETPEQVPGCQKPKTCPCPGLCHPDLPEHTIYEIPRLSRKKAGELLRQGVRSLEDLPAGYPLSERQERQVQAVKMASPFVDRRAIRAALDTLRAPLYFLDYETCNPGIPMYPGYQPYQHIVFQYSLHTLRESQGEPGHSEYLGAGTGDPTPGLLAHLEGQIDEVGSVVVWNGSFEASRNREMAQRYPAYAAFLTGINARLHDLMAIFKAGDYLHPDFHGSYALKSVLPVLVPSFESAYADLPISKGDEAMLAWLAIQSGKLNAEEVVSHREALLRYCALDSLAMVAIWRVLVALVGS